MNGSALQMRRSALPVALLLMAGCTSSAGTVPSDPRRVDTTPPTVVSRFPSRGDANGFAPFTATFDGRLDPASVTPSTVRVVQASGPVPSTVALSSDGRTIAITPAVALALPGRVEVQLTAGLADVAGNAFRTEASPWVFDMPVWASPGGPGPISDEDGPNPYPTIALDALGRTVVGMANLYPDFAVRFEQGAWVALPNPPSIGIHASIASGPDGEIWHADRAQSIQVNRLAGGVWLPVAAPLAIAAGRYPWSPRVVSTPAGPVIAWAEGISDGYGGVRGTAARADAFREGAWQGWTEGPPASWTAIAASPSGEAFASWAGGTTPLVARLAAGIELLPSPATTVQGMTAIAVAADGNPFVVFGDATGVHVRRWDGTRWTDVGGPLGAPSSPGAVTPAIALDGAGAPVVAWNENPSGTTPRQLLVSRWNGTGWTRLGGPLNADPSHDAYEVALALDARGLPVVAWAEDTGRTGNDSLGNPYKVYQMYVKRLNR